MKKLYSPTSNPELALLISLLEAENINYFIHNDHFGSLRTGPIIDLFNQKTIMVSEDDFIKASDLLNSYLSQSKPLEETEKFKSEYSVFDKIRMVLETAIFGWFMPGSRWPKQKIVKTDDK